MTKAHLAMLAAESRKLEQAGLYRPETIHPGHIVQLGHPPNRVDLMTSVKGLEFEEAWENRVEGRYGNETVFYLGRAELMRNKELVARPQDRTDLEWLKSSSPKQNR